MRVKCKSWMKGGRGVRDVSVICVRQCVYHMCTYVPPLPPLPMPPTGPISCVDVFGEMEWVVTGSEDRTIAIWKL